MFLFQQQLYQSREEIFFISIPMVKIKFREFVNKANILYKSKELQNVWVVVKTVLYVWINKKFNVLNVIKDISMMIPICFV